MMNMRTPLGFNLDLVLSYLPADFFAYSSAQHIENPIQPEINKVALLMALFGWQGHKHATLGEQLGSLETNKDNCPEQSLQLHGLGPLF